ncbi:hypothetical protein VDIAB_80049 [Vibrio diabolicus]|nr:hypothetical protein VDIAB_80049 [Vibrio diabolicus]
MALTASCLTCLFIQLTVSISSKCSNENPIGCFLIYLWSALRLLPKFIIHAFKTPPFQLIKVKQQLRSSTNLQPIKLKGLTSFWYPCCA